MAKGGKWRHRLSRWLDQWKMAISGVVLATHEWRFVLAFVLAFFIFGTLMQLLSSSTATLDLFWATDAGGKLAILGNAVLANFGVGHSSFTAWLLLFFITILQSTVIGLVVLVWQKRRRQRQSAATLATAQNFNNVSDAGIATGLAILGSGCPTCGTTLLSPLISAFASSGGFMIAGLISGLLTFASVILALFALKRIGQDAFVMITGERYLRRHAPTLTPTEESHGEK